MTMSAASVNAMKLEDQPQTVVGSLLWLIKSKKFCDVTFTFPNLPDRIDAHKFCLKARSPVFERIFRMRKSGNVRGFEIEITDSTPERFQQFLEFIYSDKFEVDIAGALDLLRLSQKYKVYPLTMKCEEFLPTEIPTMDSVKVFETARRYGRRDMMRRAGRIMIQSFLQLVATDALAFAEEETLVYLVECDDLAVKEVGLFQFVLGWGRNQVGASADQEVLRNKLENLILKIRYTNMALEEFKKVVAPTGLLSAEEIDSVYSYFTGDEIARRDLNTKFNTTPRKMETTVTEKTSLNFYKGQHVDIGEFNALSKQCVTFKADRTDADVEVWPDYHLEKTVITAIEFWWPNLKSPYEQYHTLKFSFSVGEYSGPGKDGKFTIRFQKTLLNCKETVFDRVSVEPPVELISGRTYSVFVEDHSISHLTHKFRNDPTACWGTRYANMSLEATDDLKDVPMTMSEIHRKTDYFTQEVPDWSEQFAVIRGVEIGLM